MEGYVMDIELAEARGILLMVKSGKLSNYTELARRFGSTFGFGPHSRNQVPAEWQAALDIAAAMAERLAKLEMSDLDRIAHMEKCNWTPAVTYWTDRATKAEQALLAMEEERDALALNVHAYASDMQKVVTERNALQSKLEEAVGMQNVAYDAGYYQAECGLPEHAKPADAVAAARELRRLMPEVIASLEATGCNVSLVSDLKKVLNASN